jgi:membrane-associated phospholipid phosphatase
MNLANIISFIPLLYFVFSFCSIIIKYLKQKNIIPNAIHLYGLLLATFTAAFMKIFIPYPKWFYSYTRRPLGAKDCDYCSSNGGKEGDPGFPSGHMTSTSYIVMYNILYLLDNNVTLSGLLILLNLAFLLIMGWARIIKKCHNLVQVIGGTLLGSIIGYYFYNI